MGFEESKWVWQKGEVIGWGQVTVHDSAHALHYGSGVFEGIRCYETLAGPAIFRLGGHLDRFYRSAGAYGIKVPYSRAQIEEAIRQLVLANGFQSCYVRPICNYRLQERSGNASQASLRSSRWGLDHTEKLAPWEIVTVAVKVTKGRRAEVRQVSLLAKS